MLDKPGFGRSNHWEHFGQSSHVHQVEESGGGLELQSF